MQTPPIPVNEKDRQACLNKFQILDTLPEKAFDDLAWLARKIAQTPMSAISLIDRDRQWFKSEQGLNVRETPRAISFCAYAVCGDEPFVVRDALEDVRFKENPLVLGDPGIRFYSGIPLKTQEGNNIGTLCVADKQPRTLSHEQQKMLASLAGQVMAQLELRSAGVELRSLALAAENSNRAKGEFLANMSHEIRTPMNAVMGFTDLLMESPLPVEQVDILKMIRTSAENLKRLLDDILDFSKIDAGKLALEEIAFQLPDHLARLVEFHGLRAQKKGLDLALDLDPNLPSFCVGDPLRLGQIVANLLDNAIKFTKQGHVTLRAKLLHQNGPTSLVEIEVEDSGIGLAPEKRKSIFDAFSQADGSTTRHFGGSGLGLSIASSLIKMLGGELSLDSKPGIGSTFRFTARFGKVENPTGSTDNPNGRSQKTGQEKSLHILLVEDNRMNSILAKRMLERKGHRIELAENGHQAVALFEKDLYEVVLMDLQMPGMDGFQTAKAMRELEKGKNPTPIFALSAHALSDIEKKCLDMGMNGHVPKPVNWQKLEQLLAGLST